MICSYLMIVASFLLAEGEQVIFKSYSIAELDSYRHQLENNWKFGTCSIRDTGSIIDRFDSFDHSMNVLVQTPCFDLDSLGNMMSYYVEGRICAELLNLNYVAVHKVDPILPKFINHPFFKALPDVVNSAEPPNTVVTKEIMSSVCRCRNVCHESRVGLIHSHYQRSIQIFKAAIDSYWDQRTADNAGRHIDLSSLPQDSGSVLGTGGNISLIEPTIALSTQLPVIPDVAIHYRCGDNFVGHYGFLSFWEIGDHISISDQTIYIMAEHPRRKTPLHSKGHIICDAIFEGIVKYLSSRFPNARILLIRGHDIFEDIARLAYAKTTICSVSTYCFWPAIVNPNEAYFPVTGLIAQGTDSILYGPNFHWIKPEKFLFGSTVNNDPKSVVEYLSKRHS